ncbi:MAG: AMP-binding protein, partial [Dietzia cercidiphylli]
SLIDEAGVGNPALAQITNIVYGAAPASDGLLRDLLAAFPNTRLKQAYGQTEIAGACAILPPEVHQIGDPRLSCAGRATHSVQMRIIGPDGQELPRGSAGEIAVAGPRVMRGYWNLPDQTAQTIIDGWLRTGDVGIMDDQGYVRIVDRLKDMIVSGGENVFCGEVEAVLDRHPDVAAVAVVGVPDPLWGEAVHAFVVPVSAAPDPA